MKTGEPYAFTGNDPLNEMDPLGLCWWGCSLWHRADRAYHHARRYLRRALHTRVAHALLNRVSRVAGVVSAVSSLAAIATAEVPVVGEVAEGISVASGSVAVGADLANCAGGNCNHAQVALDSAALVPGVAGLNFAGLASEAGDAAEATSAAVSASRTSINAAAHASIYGSYANVARLTGSQLSIGGLAY
jgi:hypothetical protein